LDCHIPEGKEVEGRDINRRIAQGETVITETVRRRADGRGIPVLLRGGPVVVEGKQVGILEMYRDISDRKKAEEEARYQRDYFQALFDGSPDGVVSVDMERRIRDINPAFEKMFGYGLEEIRGKDVLDYILLESEEAEGKAFSHRISHGEVVVTETVRKRADGTEIPVSLLGAPVIVEGKQVGILGIYRDITERKRAEADARYQRNYFRALFEGSPEGVVSIDMERRVTDMNPAFERIFGYSLEEVKGKDILDYILSEGKQREGKDISRRVGQGELIVTETVRKRADGTEIAVSLLGAPVMVEDRQVGILGIYRDITEHKRAEEEREALVKDLEEVNRRLGESNRELQDFAYVASHDLREPLRKVASFGTLLEESLKDRLDEDQRENFDYMIDGARRMQAMVDDLLTYSRLATRARPPERVDLNGVIEELKSLELAALLEETGGSIAVPEPLPAVQCDPSQVRQLLQNLIGNGLKFRREGIPPEVSVHAGDVEGGMVRVELRDNGIGIDEKDHEQVFTMFKRLHPRDRYGGTGIGLAVCKRIVDRHGGEIGVESGPGEGSTFWFTLPRGKPQGKKQRKE
ncbi:MAG: PAS domain S-box protein, partial [Dehalococcoidia bacterium]|nr:PAS domain S-box protein [Dehalococcoidia bacterium]